MVQKVTYTIETATENCCPTQPARLINKNNPWWTPQMSCLRKEVTALHRRCRNTQDERVHLNYKQVLKKYRKLCSQAKDRDRKRTNEMIPDEAKMAKHIKNLSEQIAPQIGSVTKIDGTNSLIGKDTHDSIMKAHFPYHTELKSTVYQKDKSISTAELEQKFKSWLSLDRIKLALNSFKDKKTPGPDGMKPIVFKYFSKNILVQLQIIYKGIIQLHFTPTPWKEARVIFIPKPGKDDYSCLLYTSPSPRD